MRVSVDLVWSMGRRFVGEIENTTGPEVYRRMPSRFVSWVFKNADGGDGRFLRTGYAEGKE